MQFITLYFGNLRRLTLIAATVLLSILVNPAMAHPENGQKQHSNVGVTDEAQTESRRIEDEAASKRIQDASIQEEDNERWKDVLVYTCFGLSLFILLWMRKKSKANPDSQE